MLAYAADAPRFADRGRHPKALFLIIVGHAALLGLVMTAKMAVERRDGPTRTDVRLIPVDPDPKPVEPDPQAQTPPRPRDPVRVPPEVDILLPDDGPTITQTPVPEPGPLPPMPGTGVGGGITATPPMPPRVVRTGPRFATPPGALRPPYPLEMRRNEEEATLKLRLTIDPAGRVTAVDAVGAADPVFLDAARRHLIARWRYKPATEDGMPVASQTVVTLRFELEE